MWLLPWAGILSRAGLPLSMPEGRKLQDGTPGDKIQLSYPLAKWMRKLKLWVQNHITVGGDAGTPILF